MSKRPRLTPKTSADDFLDFYWLKEELVAFCRAQNLPVSGSKRVLTDRIATWLRTGVVAKPGKPRTRSTSKFDWHSDRLTGKTILTDSYKNTQNVRRFFANAIGPQFSFNITFMKWLKTNSGKTLKDAVDQWHKIKTERSAPDFEPQIAPQFEYNAYVQAFMKDNPTCKRSDAIACWKVKKSQRGHNRYLKSDLKFINK